MVERTDLLTVPEVAELLRVQESTVYTWAESGVLPVYRVGRLLRFDRAQVQTWLADRGSPGTGRETGGTWPPGAREVH
jgi:excisionase family DNA binding protein